MRAIQCLAVLVGLGFVMLAANPSYASSKSIYGEKIPNPYPACKGFELMSDPYSVLGIDGTKPPQSSSVGSFAGNTKNIADTAGCADCQKNVQNKIGPNTILLSQIEKLLDSQGAELHKAVQAKQMEVQQKRYAHYKKIAACFSGDKSKECAALKEEIRKDLLKKGPELMNHMMFTLEAVPFTNFHPQNTKRGNNTYIADANGTFSSFSPVVAPKAFKGMQMTAEERKQVETELDRVYDQAESDYKKEYQKAKTKAEKKRVPQPLDRLNGYINQHRMDAGAISFEVPLFTYLENGTRKNGIPQWSDAAVAAAAQKVAEDAMSKWNKAKNLPADKLYVLAAETGAMNEVLTQKLAETKDKQAKKELCGLAAQALDHIKTRKDNINLAVMVGTVPLFMIPGIGQGAMATAVAVTAGVGLGVGYAWNSYGEYTSLKQSFTTGTNSNREEIDAAYSEFKFNAGAGLALNTALSFVGMKGGLVKIWKGIKATAAKGSEAAWATLMGQAVTKMGKGAKKFTPTGFMNGTRTALKEAPLAAGEKDQIVACMAAVASGANVAGGTICKDAEPVIIKYKDWIAKHLEPDASTAVAKGSEKASASKVAKNAVSTEDSNAVKAVEQKAGKSDIEMRVSGGSSGSKDGVTARAADSSTDSAKGEAVAAGKTAAADDAIKAARDVADPEYFSKVAQEAKGMRNTQRKLLDENKDALVELKKALKKEDAGFKALSEDAQDDIIAMAFSNMKKKKLNPSTETNRIISSCGYKT